MSSPFVRNGAAYEAEGEVEFKGRCYTYHAGWEEQECMIGGIESYLTGWETEVVDGSWGYSVLEDTSHLSQKELGALEQLIWDHAMAHSRKIDDDDWGE